MDRQDVVREVEMTVDSIADFDTGVWPRMGVKR